MKGRALWTALAAALALATGASGTPRSTTTVFVVQPDPRLCPSPLCGGWWAAAANRARTGCHDGLRRPRCYVAEIRTAAGSPTVAPGSLVVGALHSVTFGDFPGLGVLQADAIWQPAGRRAPAGGFYRLRDLGIRCVRAPCFTYRATRLNGVSRIDVSGLDLAAGGATAAELRRAETSLGTPAGVLAAGRIERTADGGRVFHATRLYLRAPLPRA